MSYSDEATTLVNNVVAQAKKNGKMSGFTIGNTAKPSASGLYFTPLRVTELMVSAGVIVYEEEQATKIAQIADGLVNYILVDVERKICSDERAASSPGLEALVRHTVSKSTLWFYKGNDLSVDAVDGLLAQLTKTDLFGLGGRKIAILGAGNIGFKLALRLVERGARVIITRRNTEMLAHLVRAINCVKSAYTQASVEGMTDNDLAAEGAEILIGTSSGGALITANMIERLAPGAIIIDVGKGGLFPAAIERARSKKMNVYRLDITAAFEGLVHHLWAVESLVETKLGRRNWQGESIISGGYLGGFDEIVVDNVHRPAVIYGIADGKGDFVRQLTDLQRTRLDRLEALVEKDRV